MTVEQGHISVQTENIFPIIKKFLYSDHEIFLRELISNAVDATQKLKTLSSKGEVKGDLGDLTIQISVDKKAKTLTISDRGIGMTGEEVKKYINQVAFSSAQEFLDKYKDDASVIGHFGLGFYSAFMVAEKVELKTKSFAEDADPVRWICDGSPEYSLETIPKEERGTDIILHLADDSEEFLEEARIQSLLDKYCKFLPIPIQFGTKKETEGEGDKKTDKEVPNIINNPNPAWTKNPTDLEDADYEAFYRELYPYSEPPLFWIHLNVDYPFHLTGILYFPKWSQTMEVQRNKIQLYSNQVFVTDEVKEIVPEWLTLLHGVIDSPDIPLNVSRSYLQSDQNVKKISQYITKKVADKLEELFKDDRKAYEEKWEHTGLFVKYGMISDEKFYERAEKFAMVQDMEDKYYTIEEIKAAVKDEQTDKDGNLVLLYTTDAEEQYTYIEAARKKGYKVLRMDTVIDSHWLSHMEHKLEKTTFTRVDSDTLNNLVKKDDKEAEPQLTDKEKENLETLFKEAMTDNSAQIQLKPLDENDLPVMITQPEFARRMMEMQRTSGMETSKKPLFYNLVVNTNHPVASKILKMKSAEKKTATVQQLVDMALLSQGMLKGKELTEFINRSVDLMK